MLDFDTYKDIEGINCLNKKDRSPYFINYEHIYPWTNENLRDFFDMFDVNQFSKYVSALKIAMIKKYGYYDFFKRMD